MRSKSPSWGHGWGHGLPRDRSPTASAQLRSSSTAVDVVVAVRCRNPARSSLSARLRDWSLRLLDARAATDAGAGRSASAGRALLLHALGGHACSVTALRCDQLRSRTRAPGPDRRTAIARSGAPASRPRYVSRPGACWFAVSRLTPGARRAAWRASRRCRVQPDWEAACRSEQASGFRSETTIARLRLPIVLVVQSISIRGHARVRAEQNLELHRPCGSDCRSRSERQSHRVHRKCGVFATRQLTALSIATARYCAHLLHGKLRAHRGACDAGSLLCYRGLLGPRRVALAPASPLENELERSAADHDPPVGVGELDVDGVRKPRSI